MGGASGVQLYGAEPNRELCAFIEAAGAEVRTVAPYIYAPASDGAKVVELIGEMAAGRVDVVAFTSAAQIDRLFEVARAHDILPVLASAWPRVRVAAIGPIAAEALRRHGVEPAIVPDKAYVMKRLVSAIVAAVASG